MNCTQQTFLQIESCREANGGTDHYLVYVKYRQRIGLYGWKSRKMQCFDVEKLKWYERIREQQYKEKLLKEVITEVAWEFLDATKEGSVMIGLMQIVSSKKSKEWIYKIDVIK